MCPAAQCRPHISVALVEVLGQALISVAVAENLLQQLGVVVKADVHLTALTEGGSVREPAVGRVGSSR